MATTQLYARTHFTDDELAEKGTLYPQGRLVDGARERLAYFAEDQAHFGTGYFDAGWLSLMNQAVGAVEANKGSREIAQSGARPSGGQAAAAAHALHAWKSEYDGAVELAAPDVQALAPHAPRHWDHLTLMSSALEPLVQFAEAHPEITVLGAGVTPIGADGRTALEAFKQVRTVHKVALGDVSPQVKALHVAEGLLVVELERLATASKKAVSPERAKLYGTAGLHGRTAHHAQADKAVDPAAKVAPATPAKPAADETK